MVADVIIVGMGAAGIAAALELTDRSIPVLAIEARDRVGGRVMWAPVGSLAAPAELGAEFIHGEAPETSALLREAGLDTVENGEVSWTRGTTGELEPVQDDTSAGGLFEGVRALDADESVAAFLQRFEHDPEMREQARLARAFVEGFEAADPALASARAIADELASGVDATTSRPVGTYAPLFEHLTARCARARVDLRLRTTVERIAWEPGRVTIEARDARGAVSLVSARCAIITLPLGVLQQRHGAAHLRFTPALPAAKQTALRGLEMGQAVRVTLAFRTPFWETIDGGRYRDAAFFRCDAGAFSAFWTRMPIRGRTIVAWAGGPRATAMDGLSAQARIDRAREAFGALLGERERTRAEFEAGVTHDWASDPFACGAYSYVVAGAGAARAALGEAVADTLFFAGEATSTSGQGGTVSGAFETGKRAASEVAHALHALSDRII